MNRARRIGLFFAAAFPLVAACGNKDDSDRSAGDDGAGGTTEVASTGGRTGTGTGGSTGSGTGTGTSSSGLVFDGFFVIGVYGQSIEGNRPNPAVWRSRGVNTFMAKGDSEEYVTTAEWDAALEAQGMKAIREPAPNPADDIGNDTLLAWLQPDEPDVEGVNSEVCDAYRSVDPDYPCVAECEANFEAWRAIDPTRPILVNISGVDVWANSAYGFCNGPGDPEPEPGENVPYPEASNCYPRLFASADWISEDMYPVTGWMPDELRDDLSSIGLILDRLAEWTDKPRLAVIETSDQNLPGLEDLGGVTPDQYRAEVWVAIIHGARGIVYFPFDIGPNSWSYDTTPDDVIEEMRVQHVIIEELAPTLQGEINPAEVGAEVDGPLEAGWRMTESVAYFFVLNPSGATVPDATVTFSGVPDTTTAEVFSESRSVDVQQGELTDSFGPYELHIYVVQTAG
jgi:hypothetical protein